MSFPCPSRAIGEDRNIKSIEKMLYSRRHYCNPFISIIYSRWMNFKEKKLCMFLNITFVIKDCLLRSKLIIHTAELESINFIIVLVRWDLDQ